MLANQWVLLLIVLAFYGLAGAQDANPEVTTEAAPVEATTPTSQEQLYEEVKKSFIPKLNKYRREVAKRLNWTNMNELVYGEVEGYHDSLYSYNLTLDGLLTEIIEESEEEMQKALNEKKTLCQDKDGVNGFCPDHINPEPKAVSCDYVCYGYCTKYDLTCYLTPTSNTAWWKNQTIGEPGSACDPDRYNIDGLCSLNPPTTTTTTTVKPPPATPKPAKEKDPKKADGSSDDGDGGDLKSKESGNADSSCATFPNLVAICIVSIVTYSGTLLY